MAARKTPQPPETVLRDFAMSFPDATEDFPWGERAIKVKGKVFLFLSRHDGDLHLSVKLPTSSGEALKLPYVRPTAYGLGKHGWVSATFEQAAAVPLDTLRDWIEESFRAVAPKAVLAKLAKSDTLDVVILQPRRKKPAKK